MLHLRLITGPILILALLAIVFFDERLAPSIGEPALPRGSLLVVVAIVAAVLASRELTTVLRAKQIAVQPLVFGWAAALGVIAMWIGPIAAGEAGGSGDALRMGATPLLPVATGAALTLFAAALGRARTRSTDGAVGSIAAALFLFVYPGVMLGFLLQIRHAHSAWWIVGVVMATKACDIGAYFTGRSIGKTKLIPWLSPGKTWEGLVGGLILATATGAGLAAASRGLTNEADHVSIPIGMIAGFLFGGVGQMGDLLMSLCKRDAGLKDSSTLLPGMGGVMDVLDSPLLVAPIAWWLFAIV